MPKMGFKEKKHLLFEHIYIKINESARSDLEET